MYFCNQRCVRSPFPSDFVFDREKGEFDFDRVRSDRDLVKLVQTGRTENFLFRNPEGTIRINEFFGGLTPRKVYQNPRTSENNLEQA